MIVCSSCDKMITDANGAYYCHVACVITSEVICFSVLQAVHQDNEVITGCVIGRTWSRLPEVQWSDAVLTSDPYFNSVEAWRGTDKTVQEHAGCLTNFTVVQLHTDY